MRDVDNPVPTVTATNSNPTRVAAAVPANWRGSDEHVLSGIVWYPAETNAGEKDRYIGPPDAPLFYAGRAAKDAVLAPVFGKYLVIALSHGTGGSAMQMAWLGTYLAARGFHCRRRQSSRQQRGHRVHNPRTLSKGSSEQETLARSSATCSKIAVLAPKSILIASVRPDFRMGDTA
jgi:hypothetical protein